MLVFAPLAAIAEYLGVGFRVIYILYSADYELYLGGNNLPEEEVLIHPTEALLAVCEQLGIPLTLFCDVACLWRYRTLGRDRFPDLAEGQLQDAVARGHDVQTHLHPHWLTARFTDGQYHFDPAHYLLGTLSQDPADCLLRIRQLLARARDMLTTLLRPHAPKYRCLAFRAGGYGLQPGEGMILQALLETGYRIDSSIIPGAVFRTNVQRVDFSSVPQAPNYGLSPSGGLSQPAVAGEGIFEIPIAAMRVGVADARWVNGRTAVWRAVDILLGKELRRPVRGHPCNALAPGPVAGRIRRAYWGARACLDVRFHRLELSTDARLMAACARAYLAPFEGRGGDVFFSLNSHPKGVTSGHLQALRRFHAHMVAHFGGQLQALTFQQAWQKIAPVRHGSKIVHLG